MAAAFPRRAKRGRMFHPLTDVQRRRAWMPVSPGLSWDRVQGLLPRTSSPRRQSRPVPVGYGIGPWIASAAQTESEYPAHPPLQSPGQPFCPIRPCGKARRKEAPRGLLHGRAFHPGANAGGSPRGNRGAGPSALLAREKGAGCSSPLPACKGC